MTTPAALDRFDLAILNILQADNTTPQRAIAQAVNLSAPAVQRRIQRLKEEGVIRGQVTLLDRKKIGLNTQIFAEVKLNAHGRSNFTEFTEAVRGFPEVLECLLITGQQSDYQLKVVVGDMDAYQDLLLNKITRIQGVTGVHTSFVLRKVVDRTALPV